MSVMNVEKLKMLRVTRNSEIPITLNVNNEPVPRIVYEITSVLSRMCVFLRRITFRSNGTTRFSRANVSRPRRWRK